MRYDILQNSSQGHHKQRQHGSSLINGAQICSNQDEFVQLYAWRRVCQARHNTDSVLVYIQMQAFPAIAGIWTPLVAALDMSQQVRSAHSALKVMSLLLFRHLNPAQVAILFRSLLISDSSNNGYGGLSSCYRVTCWGFKCCSLHNPIFC